MATRKDARVAVIQILYALDLGNEEMLEKLDSFLKERKILNKQAEFATSLISGVCKNNDFIIDTMNIFLKTSWDIDRLGAIEKNILKLGIYELLYTQTQKAVVINEAIELTKDFNVSDAFRLVNGVLDSISKVDIEGITNRISKAKLESKKAQSSKEEAKKTHSKALDSTNADSKHSRYKKDPSNTQKKPSKAKSITKMPKPSKTKHTKIKKDTTDSNANNNPQDSTKE